MAPKKKQEQQKMSLGAFLQDDNFGGSWADEVEDTIGSQPLPPATHERRGGPSGYSSYGGGFGERSYPSRDSFPTELPTKPPYTAHLGNLSYDATTETVTEFLEGCDVISVRIIEDRIEQRPKGFAYAEFKDLEGLKKALTLDGESFQGRNIRIKIADPPKNDRGDRGFGGEGSARDLSSWDRKGPLPDLPGRNDSRRDFSERRGPPRDAPVDDGKVRDFGNWERRGPLSPLPQRENDDSRDSSRPRTNDGQRADSFRGERGDRRTSPATWGEGRQEGSRPPRGEFRERPERAERPERPERAPTAAELDNKWRTNMRPDRSTPEQSGEASEAASPVSTAAAPGGRPKLNLQKRTVSEAPGIASPPATSAADSKANPFGAARPIDTAAKEREIAEKQDQLAKEKKEADEKAKEERRLAKEAAVKEAADKAAAEAEAEKAKENAPAPEAAESTEAPAQGENDAAGEQKIPTRPKEQVQNPKSRAADAGNWRSSSGEARGGRGGYQNAPRGGRGDLRGGRSESRGGRGGRGGRFEGGRPPRENGSSPAPAQQQTDSATPTTPAAEESADPDGWTTVPSKGRRNQSTRA